MAVVLSIVSILVLGAAPAAAQASSSAALVVDVPADALYHEPGCPLVRRAGASAKVLKESDAIRLGMKPHACTEMDPAEAEPDPNAQPVVVQPGDNKYHKAGCRTLRAKTSTMPLADAGRSHWPCNVCKPPIRKPPRRR